MAKKSGGADRSVTYTLAISTDPKYRANLDKFKIDTLKTFSDIESGNTKLLANADKENLRYWAKQARLMDKALADKERYWARESAKMDAKLARDERAHAASLAKLDSDLATSAQRRANEEIKENKRLFAFQQQQQKSAKARDAQQVDSIKGIIGGVSQLTRAYYLLGLATEEDKTKALEAAAQFESMIQSVAGVTAVVSEGVKLWKSYAAARKAAALADAAGGVASAASGGGGKGGGGGGGLGSAMAGIAGPAGIAIAAFAALGTALYAIGEAAGESGEKLTGFKDVANQWSQGWNEVFGTAGKTIADKSAARRKADNLNDAEHVKITAAGAREVRGFDIEEAGLAARRGKTGRAADAAEVAALSGEAAKDLAGARTRKDEAQANLNWKGAGDAATVAEMKAAQEDQLNALERQRTLIRESARLEIDAKKEALAASEKITDTLKQQYETQQKAAKEARDSLKSAAERFGEMDPLQQQRAKDALNKLNKGGELNAEERGLVRSVGLDTANKQLSSQLEQKGLAGGLGDVAQFKEQQQQAAAAEKAAKDIQVKIDEEVKVQLELTGNIQSIEDKLLEKLKPIIDELRGLARERTAVEQERNASLRQR